MRLVVTPLVCSSQKNDSHVSSTVKDCKDYSDKREVLRELNENDIPNKKCGAHDFVTGFRKTLDVQHKSVAGQIDKAYVEDGASKQNTPKNVVDVSHKFEFSKTIRATMERLEETDTHRLNQRQKQIDYGKNTLGYECYVKLVTRNKRRLSDPQTPDRNKPCSKRRWDGLVRQWRRQLHAFDPPLGKDEENPHLYFVDGKNKDNRTSKQLI